MTIMQHTITVGNMRIFARELVRNPDAPALLFLQGGPGQASPRQFFDWMDVALDHYRVFLLDQRGTGRSTRIDRFAGLIDASTLLSLSSAHIITDAEALREHLGIERWTLLGQSFGGFVATQYAAAHPDSLEAVMLTGGLPATTVGIDDVYRATYQQMAVLNRAWWKQWPFVKERVREMCHHLDNADEHLLTGERLSSRRFRTIGTVLGQTGGSTTLAMLLEEPFHHVRGEKRLRGDTLAALTGYLSFESAPLYAAIHESIYGGVHCTTTNWSAHRIREEIPGFEESADALIYLTGEHIYPWQFEEDPALRPFAQAAEELAHHEFTTSPYGPVDVPSVAAVYTADAYVPYAYSLDTARSFSNLNVIEFPRHHHDALRVDGRTIMEALLARL